ncbi:hypothetical protein [uncultured Tateyamaria sp.]|uniref:hypothetical protein n=1 Tax=uncultured Tateyamaria sp. TaxID=455651 RepID=UPI00260CD728|nr:hypothetical protein [uncultured Tateyamaria sp.]
MPLLGLICLGVMFAGVMYMRDDRQDVRRVAKGGVIGGTIGATLVAMVAFGPMIALILFAAFVALSFLNQFWT